MAPHKPLFFGRSHASDLARAIWMVRERQGDRDRTLETRLGTLELKVPKLRSGPSAFPPFLEPRRTIEKALTAVIQEAWISGVSTRRVEDLVQAMGMSGLSKSQVSKLGKEIDERVIRHPVDCFAISHSQSPAIPRRHSHPRGLRPADTGQGARVMARHCRLCSQQPAEAGPGDGRAWSASSPTKPRSSG